MASLLNIGTRAMNANYAALTTIGNNISNVNTAGYSRQEVQLATEQGFYTGAGFFGNGVRVQTVVRSSNEFLTKEAALTKAQAAADTTRLSQLQQLEKLFPTGTGSIGQAAQEMLNAFTDVASQPQDASARQVVLSRAEEFAARMRSAGSQLNALQAGVNADLRSSVATVNEMTQQVADLNQQIASYRGSTHTPNDLLDKRDQLINQISEYIQVTTVPADDGSVGLFIGGGQRLVLGNQAQQLSITPDSFDKSKSRISINEVNGTRELDASSLAGGSLTGLIAFQDKDLTDARNMLGQMAAAFSARVNEQQALGLDQRNPPGAGAAIFDVGDPRVLPSSKNATGAAASSVSITVADATQLLASDYKLQPDPATPGNFLVTRMSDGLQRSVANGDTIDGFTINVTEPGGAGTMAGGDKFLLQPLAQAASDMQSVLTDPTGIAAASPVVGTLGNANTGTAAVASLSVTSAPALPYSTVQVYFNSATGDYALYDGSVTMPPSGADVPLATGTWQAGQAISYNGWQLKLSGVPANGDVINVSPTTYPASNNGNASAMLALRDEAMVGRQDLGGGNIAPGTTITDAYAQAMSNIGVRVQGAKSTAAISQSIADNAQASMSNETGVNLDEEAARLIQFQQSYQACAKVLQVAQTVFDTLLQMNR